MKKLFLLFAIISLTQVSCEKTDLVTSAPTSLDGQWRMILVKENTSGFRITKPSSIKGDVDITFTSTSAINGTFIGNTPTNTIHKNDYLIGENQSIVIPNLGMTKVGETSWGKEFVDNIRSAKKYNFENDGRVTIKTTKNTLTFRKL